MPKAGADYGPALTSTSKSNVELGRAGDDDATGIDGKGATQCRLDFDRLTQATRLSSSRPRFFAAAAEAGVFEVRSIAKFEYLVKESTRKY